MQSKIVKILLIWLIVITFSIGIYGLFLKKDESVDEPKEDMCNYNLDNINYNNELKKLCESTNIKYTAYTSLDFLNNKGKYYFEDNIAKYFNSEYYTNINETTNQTKKYLILSYLDFKENTCYLKNLINEVGKNIFSTDENIENNINSIFDASEIKNNFICISNINSNNVIKLNLNEEEYDYERQFYYLINNKDKIEIDNQEKTIKNLNNYSIEDMEKSGFVSMKISENISNYITLDLFDDIKDNDYLKIDNEYIIDNKTTLKLENNNLYINSELLFRNVDKLIIDIKNQNIIILNKSQIYVIKFSDLRNFTSIDDYKIKNYEFNNIYLYNNKFTKSKDLIFETKDNKYYSLEKLNIIDVYSIEKEIYLDKSNTPKYKYEINTSDSSVTVNNQNINIKAKMLLGNYFITDDDYLYSMYENNKLIDSKIKSIYRFIFNTNNKNTIYKFFVEFDNNEKLMFYDFY